MPRLDTLVSFALFLVVIILLSFFFFSVLLFQIYLYIYTFPMKLVKQLAGKVELIRSSK